jgi:hypothetical protein
MCRVVPVRSAPRSTAAELARLLPAFPRVDAGYGKDVERAIRQQGKVPKSRWGR